MPTTEQTPRIGFLGLGYMGSRMARRLLDAGYPLVVHNRTRDKARSLESAGATFANSPKDLAASCDFLMSSLANDGVVEAMYYGPAGVLAGAKPGLILVETSTVHPQTAKVLHEAAIAKGVLMLDTPVSGSTPQAEGGQLVFFVGGDEGIYRECEFIFTTLGKAHYYMGPPGSGAMMKLVTNALLGIGAQALAEAMAFGQKGGLKVESILEALSQTAVMSPGMKAKGPNVAKGEYPPTFPLRLMYKDFGLVAKRAQELSVPMPMTAAAHQFAAGAMAHGAGEEDFSVVAKFLAQAAGVKRA
jgi:3-hydroxyisobutyrate dehydrogenase-like beta-hydroxyacid dehydrogenase